jgi:4-hydroxy-3-methylbut-2-enyl diphosphate reductase
MAIECRERALQLLGAPVFVYHEIVHNKYVVEQFRRKGAIFVDDLAQVPEGATLLYSAQGVSPEVRKLSRQRRLRTIDSTCPLVAKVHLEAIHFAQRHYTIILIGHAGHDEVLGTLGEAPASIRLGYIRHFSYNFWLGRMPTLGWSRRDR